MRLKHSLPEILVRLLVTFFGLFMLALGIDLTILADLGTDAITSPALAASTLLEPDYPFFTVGNTLICLHVLLILSQIVLLRRNYDPVQLLQVVMSFTLGSMVDALLPCVKQLPVPDYMAQLGYTLLACVVCAFGIFSFVKANLVPLPAEGFCVALSRTFKLKFSRVKVGLDCAMVVFAVALSLIFLDTVVGVREGTLICATTIGLIIGLFFHIFPYWDKLFAAVGHRSGAEKEDSFD